MALGFGFGSDPHLLDPLCHTKLIKLFDSHASTNTHLTASSMLLRVQLVKGLGVEGEGPGLDCGGPVPATPQTCAESVGLTKTAPTHPHTCTTSLLPFHTF